MIGGRGAEGPARGLESVVEVFRVAVGLGLTSFGGPIAHLGYFRRTYVMERRRLDEGTYADLVALCQSLPGPASSQLGIAIGTHRAGIWGGLAAWLGFTLPSAKRATLAASTANPCIGRTTDASRLADAEDSAGHRQVATEVPRNDRCSQAERSGPVVRAPR